MPSYQDPAERHGYLRWFYRGWRPTRFGRFHNSIWAWLAGLGLTSPVLVTLEVKDRSTDQLRSVVLVAADYEEHRYLVSMLGDSSEWVQNLRAARGMAFIKRGQSYPVMLTEIPPEERAPILRAWCQVATSGRQHLPVSAQDPVSAFEAIAGDYPVFRIDSRSSA